MRMPVRAQRGVARRRRCPLPGRRRRARPSARSPIATSMTPSPSRRRRSASATNGAGSMSSAASSASLPTAMRRAATVATNALARSSTRNAATGGEAKSRARRGGGDDRRRQRMLAAAFGRGGELQHLILGDLAGGERGDDGRGLPFGQGAGLVEHERVDLRDEPLDRLGGSRTSTPAARAAPGADHDRHRRRRDRARRARAINSTEIAATNAWPSATAGSRRIAQAEERDRRRRFSTAGTKRPATASARRC